MDFVRRYFQTRNKKYRNSPTIHVNLHWDLIGIPSKVYSPKVTIPGNKFYVLFNEPEKEKPDIVPPYPGENIPNEGPLPEVPILGAFGLIDLGPPPDDLEEFFANLPLPPVPDIAPEDQENATAAVQAAAAELTAAQVIATHAATQAAELLAEVQVVSGTDGFQLPVLLPLPIGEDEAQNLVVTGTAIELQPGGTAEEEEDDASDISIHQSNSGDDDTTSSTSDDEDYLIAQAATAAYHAHQMVLSALQRALEGIVPRMSHVSSSDSSSSSDVTQQQSRASSDEEIAGYSGGVRYNTKIASEDSTTNEQVEQQDVGEGKQAIEEIAALTIQQVIAAAFDRLAITADRRASVESTSAEEPIPQEAGASGEGAIASTEKEEPCVGASGEEPQPGLTEEGSPEGDN